MDQPVGALDTCDFLEFMRGIEHPHKPYALAIALMGVNALRLTEVLAADVGDVRRQSTRLTYTSAPEGQTFGLRLSPN